MAGVALSKSALKYYYIWVMNILAAFARDGFRKKEVDELDDPSSLLCFLMERLDSEGRFSVCTNDSLHLHHFGKPGFTGKAAFISNMRPVAVIRSEDVFNALPTDEPKSHRLGSLIVRRLVRMVPIYRAYPYLLAVDALGTQTKRSCQGSMTFVASWELLGLYGGFLSNSAEGRGGVCGRRMTQKRRRKLLTILR